MKSLTSGTPDIITNREKIINEFLKSVDIVPSTRESYRKGINKWLGYLEKNNIKEPTLETMKIFKDEVLSECEPSYWNTILTAIKSLYNYLEKHYHIINLCSEIKNEKIDIRHKRNGLNEEQARQLIKASKGKDLRCQCLIKLGLVLGTRTIEIERLNIDNIVEECGKHYVYLWRKGRKKADIKMFLPNNLYELLMRYINEERKIYCKDNNKGSVPLFITADRNPKYQGNRLRTRAIRNLITGCIDEVIEDRQKEKISSHSLRRTSIGEVVRREGITVAMQHASHSSSKITQIYLDEEIEVEQKEKAVNVLNTIFN